MFNTIVGLFYTSKPFALFDQDHPDWGPTKLMGHISTFLASASKDDAVGRYDRAKIQAGKVRQSLEEQQVYTEVFDNKENDCTTINDNVVNNNHGDYENVHGKRTVEIQT